MRNRIPVMFAAAFLTVAFANGIAMGEEKSEVKLKEVSLAIEGMT